MTDILIIGGGAAGLMAAGVASMAGKSVVILERNERPARKVMITGKGRCNVTNNCDSLDELISNVPVNSRFLYSAFSSFMPRDTMELFEDMGVPLKTERGNRVFPVSDKAVDIVDALTAFATDDGAQIINARATELIIEDGCVKGVMTESGEAFYAEKVLVATGGKSYPVTGSTGDGYDFARQAGHTVTQLKPSLVSLVCHEGFCTDLQGLALRNVAIKVVDTAKKKEIYRDMGEMLFTHFGISGPLVLSASAFYKSGKNYRVEIDLKPALSIEQLDNRILRDFSELQNKDFANSLDALLPKSLIPVTVKLSGIPSDKKVNQISREERRTLCEVIKKFPLHITSLRPLEEAIITRGGISVKEINPATMESKLVKGLYFAGEVIDVDAFTGGFNLQIAFSTGFLAGQNL